MSQKGHTNTALALAGISEGLKSFFEAKMKKDEREEDQRILEALQNPELSAMQKVHLVGKLSNQGQKSLNNILTIQNRIDRESESRRRHIEDQEYRQGKEERLHSQHLAKDISRAYKEQMQSLKDDLADPRLFDKEQRRQLKEEQKALQQEHIKNLNRIRKGQQPVFNALRVQDEAMPAQSVGLEASNQLGGMSEPVQQIVPSQQAGPQKQLWNPSNPAHKQRAIQVLQEVGDRSRANQILAEEFEYGR